MSFEKLPELISVIRQKKLKIGFAESCTGGLLSSVFSSVPGVSDIFQGSIICYSNDIKLNILKVNAKTLEQFGAVSEQTAREMAIGAQKILAVDIVVSISGIAGPSGGSKDKPVGTVFFHFIGPGFEYGEKKLFAGSRLEIQNASVEFTINSLLTASH